MRNFLFTRLLRGSVRRLRSAELLKASRNASGHGGMVKPKLGAQMVYPSMRILKINSTSYCPQGDLDCKYLCSR